MEVLIPSSIRVTSLVAKVGLSPFSSCRLQDVFLLNICHIHLINFPRKILNQFEIKQAPLRGETVSLHSLSVSNNKTQHIKYIKNKKTFLSNKKYHLLKNLTNIMIKLFFFNRI